MPVFTQQLGKIDAQDPVKALKQMERHIRYIQTQLEYTLTTLDSSNIREIRTDETDITSSTGSTNLTGDAVALIGQNGEIFRAGKDKTSGNFTFEIKGKNGMQYIYMNNNGDLIITKNTTLTIDCGEW